MTRQLFYQWIAVFAAIDLMINPMAIAEMDSPRVHFNQAICFESQALELPLIAQSGPARLNATHWSRSLFPALTPHDDIVPPEKIKNLKIILKERYSETFGFPEADAWLDDFCQFALTGALFMYFTNNKTETAKKMLRILNDRIVGDPRDTLELLGHKMGKTRERVRQIQTNEWRLIERAGRYFDLMQRRISNSTDLDTHEEFLNAPLGLLWFMGAKFYIDGILAHSGEDHARIREAIYLVESDKFDGFGKKSIQVLQERLSLFGFGLSTIRPLTKEISDALPSGLMVLRNNIQELKKLQFTSYVFPEDHVRFIYREWTHRFMPSQFEAELSLKPYETWYWSGKEMRIRTRTHLYSLPVSNLRLTVENLATIVLHMAPSDIEGFYSLGLDLRGDLIRTQGGLWRIQASAA